ncbi:MAG: ABC transporter permease [Candidatus Acidiferrales bacterium]
MLTEWIRAAWLRAKTLAKRRQLERDLKDELQFHLAMREEKFRGDESPREGEPARAAARRKFGNATLLKEVCWDMWTFHSMENFLQDLRYGARMLRKSLDFTVIAVLTLALGIGANTAIFSVVNAVLLKPLPYPDANRVTMMYLQEPSLPLGRGDMGDADFLALEQQQHSFESVAAYKPSDNGFTLTGNGEPQEIPGGHVTARFFDVFGVKPMLGRTFSLGEDRGGQPLTVVVSNRFWREHLQSDPQAVGRSITIDQQNFTVVGVMPATFHFDDRGTDELWPIMQMETPHQRPPYFLTVFGRLKPGVSLATASADASRIAESVTRQYPLSNIHSATVVPMKQVVVRDSVAPLLILLGAVALVLLITIVNVANLQVSRAATRKKEMAIRTALGAGRLRLVRQLLTESVLLGGIGGALGLALAYGGVKAIVVLGADLLPRMDEVAVDWRVLVFATMVTLLSSILFGLAPAMRTRAARLDESLKETGRGGGESAGSRLLHDALVVVEFSLAAVLLIAAGLLIGSLMKLEAVNPGFQPEHILTMRVDLPPVHYTKASETTAFYRQLLEKTENIPGVQSAAVAMSLPPNITAAMRSAVDSIDASAPLAKVQTMDQLLSQSVTAPRLGTVLLSSFAALALLLGAIGIYGVMSYAVAQRTHEIGVRIALGAQQRDVLRLVLGSGAKLALMGSAIRCGRIAGVDAVSVEFGISPTDLRTFSGVAVLLMAVALVACYLPTRRAMRVDPMTALRHE